MHTCSVSQHIEIIPGTLADFAAMKQFHYRGGMPGGVMRVLVAWHRAPGERPLRAGVLVETLPPLGCMLRNLALPGFLPPDDRSLAAAKLNRDMRTIARAVVHPIFRSLGLAVRLVRRALESAATPYVEALAAMGRVHPFFEKAGMKPYDRPAAPDAVRLRAALTHAGHGELDLVKLRPDDLSAFLRRELLRFARKKTTPEAALAEARTRLLSQPIYYLWKNPFEKEKP